MRATTTAALAALMVAGGCRRGPEAPVDQSSAGVIAAARARAVPRALQAGFSVTLKGTATEGTTRGGLVLHQPDNLRVDIFTPLNTPLAYIASDGQALHAWLQQERVFFRGDDASAVLDETLGGLGGVGDAVDLLTGTLPLEDAEVLDARYDEEAGLLQVVLQGPRDVEVRAGLETSGALRTLDIVQPGDEAPAVLVEVDYPDYVRVEGHDLPAEISLHAPSLGWTVGIKVDTWNVLGQIPEVFTLAPPPGAAERDLVEALQEMAARRQP